MSVPILTSFSLCLFPVQAMNTLRVPSTQLLQTGHLNKDKLHVVVVIVIQNQNVLPEGKPSVSHQLLDTASVDTNMTLLLFIYNLTHWKSNYIEPDTPLSKYK